jgi:protein NRD1
VTPPARRESPTYGVYDPTIAKSETPRGNDFDRRDRGRGKGRDNYRKRSPPRERLASPSMMGRSVQGDPGSTPKPFGHDPSLSNGRIRGTTRFLITTNICLLHIQFLAVLCS